MITFKLNQLVTFSKISPMTYVRANVEMLVTNVTNYNIYVTNPLTGASTYFDKHYLNSCVVKSIKEVLPC